MPGFIGKLFGRGALPVIILLTYVGIGLAQPAFWSMSNLINILEQSSYLIMLAVAQMMTLLLRGFDLSVGSVIGMISVAASLTMAAVFRSHPDAVWYSLAMGWLMGLAIGLAVGAVNGFVIAYLRVSPFMATLATMSIALGFATTISGGFPVLDLPPAYAEIFGRAKVLGLPMPVVFCIGVLIVIQLLLNRTVFGRRVYVMGNNPRPAYVSGMNTRFVLARAYVVCSLITAVVAMLLTARTGSGEPRLGMSLMFESLMAAIIGGVSLTGGEGRILHCIMGGIFVTMLGNGMNMIRVDSNIQMIVLGTVLIATIVADRLRTGTR